MYLDDYIMTVVVAHTSVRVSVHTMYTNPYTGNIAYLWIFAEKKTALIETDKHITCVTQFVAPL